MVPAFAKMHPMKAVFSILPAFLLTTMLSAQSDASIFARRLDSLGAEIVMPIDGDYRPRYIENNPIQAYHWALGSRKDKLEIRFFILPWRGQAILNFPHIEAARVARQVASNDPDAVMTARDLTDEELFDLFNADWGRIYLFAPKPHFGLFEHCKMIALFREERGMAFIFQLFDEPGPNIDRRLHAFQFLD